mgnify:CR=1 FL=1
MTKHKQDQPDCSPSSQCTPQTFEPEGQGYDTFHGTEQECHQAQHLLMKLVMVMDEFHARGNLIDSLRDAIEQRVRWRGGRAVGMQMWQAAWSRWGPMDFYKLNWRGYGHAHGQARGKPVGKRMGKLMSALGGRIGAYRPGLSAGYR